MKYFVHHVDLDGFGCWCFYKLFLEHQGWVCVSANYGEMEQGSLLHKKLTAADVEVLYFADITPSKVILQDVDNSIVYVVDHHRAACEAISEEHPLVHMVPFDLMDNNSGTSLLFDRTPFCEEVGWGRLDEALQLWKPFSDRVRVYDLWLDDHELWKEAVHLQQLWVRFSFSRATSKVFDQTHTVWFRMLKERFAQDVVPQNYWMKLSEREYQIAATFDKEFPSQVRQCARNLRTYRDNKDNLYGAFACGSRNSLVCAELLKLYPELKYIICVNSYHAAFGQVSARTRADRDFDCRTLENFGGHPAASGANFGVKASRIVDGSIIMSIRDEECASDSKESNPQR